MVKNIEEGADSCSKHLYQQRKKETQAANIWLVTSGSANLPLVSWALRNGGEHHGPDSITR